MLNKLLMPVFLVGCVFTITGCNGSSSESPDLSAAAAKPQESNDSGVDFPRFTTKWSGPDGASQEESGNAVSPEFLAKGFEQLDWSKPAAKPSLAVELSADQALAITLAPEATEEQKILIAVWTKPGPQLGAATTTMVQRSKPLRDDEHALELLNAFAKGDEDFQSLVEWEEKAPDSGD